MGPETLVTGATGNVGSEVLRLLRAGGHSARAAVRDTAPSRVAPDELVEPVAFDFGRPETHGPALAGVRGVFLVRPPELGDTRRYFDPFISAARDAGVRRVVFLSLQGADRLRVVPHRRIERSLEHSGLPYTFLRSSFFMQNLSTIHRAEIRDTGEIFVPAGRGRTSFVDVRDIAAVAVRALSEPGHEGRAYELTGSEALNYFQVASILSEALGRRIEYANPSIPAFLASMRRRRYRPGFALVTTAIYTTARLGFAGRVSPDTGQLLGRPPCSLRRFAEDYAGCWRRGSDTESG